MNIDFSKLYIPLKIEKNNETQGITEILEQEELLYVISKNIITYRKENNLTQEELAKKINVNQTMISKLESGNYNPTFKQIYKITKKLTGSIELFNKILEEMISSLKKYDEIQYNMFIKSECTNNLNNLYIQEENKKIIFLNIDKDLKKKIGESYEEYKSTIPIVG